VHARADVWTYVDAQGVTHFSSTQLDARYEVFFRGRSSLDNVDGPSGENPPLLAAPEMSTATARMIAYLESAPGFKSAQTHMRTAASTHLVDFALLQALIATESGFDAGAISPKGAVGLMQVMPATAARYGVASDRVASVERKLVDPKININTGTRYLRDLIRMFPGQLELALAAYNAGEGAVQKAGNKIPNFKETQNYVKTVMQLYAGLNPQAARSPAPVVDGRVRAEFHGAGMAPELPRPTGFGGRSNMVPALTAAISQPLALSIELSNALPVAAAD
jgi:soluble lytic murein transglycosylase-like protein